MNKIYTFIYSIVFASIFSSAAAQTVGPDMIRFGNEANDTTEITRILIDELKIAPNAETPQRVSRLTKIFEGRPYQAGTLEGTPEKLTVRIDAFDCTTLAETVMALAITASENRSSWRDYIYNLERVRYRNGRMKDYASRIHYISQWGIDLANRGIIKEVTEDVANSTSYIKTLDYMTRNRDKYPALADDATYRAMKEAEMGYRSHKIPYIKAQHAKDATLREGDIVAFTTKQPGIDAIHVGIITMINGKPHLIHASSVAGKVMTEPVPLNDYLRRNRQMSGIKVFRLLDN